MPEEPRCDGSPRPPRLNDPHEDRRLRACWKALRLRHGGREGGVTGRPDIRAPEDHQQVDRRGPAADARDGLEGLLDAVIVECLQPVEVEGAIGDARGERPPVAGLLATEPDRQQLRIVEGEERLGRERVRRREQPIVRSPGRRERDLLLEDDVNERAEAGGPIPERR